MNITNTHDIPLALAVWLVSDYYDYQNQENYISATTLMKPIRQLVLGARTLRDGLTTDLSEYVARAMGNSLHDSIEKAWTENYQKSLQILGYPDSMIDRVLINPTEQQLASVQNPIPVYLEQRATAKVGKWTVGGKFDLVADGVVHDNKSTTVYSWINQDKDADYALQGSIYRWLNQGKITEDFIRINFIFTDWQRSMVNSKPEYPSARAQHREIPLMSIADTEKWITNKLIQIEKYWDLPDAQIPECTDEELWRSNPVFKYYSDPTKTGGRSTRNFPTLVEANQYKAEKLKGVVLSVPGEPKRCNYCDAFAHCQQARRYFP